MRVVVMEMVMRRRSLLAALSAAPVLTRSAAAHAAPARQVVLELFTSQGCSSCPPADALLTELSAQPGLLALAFHITYWDRLGWRDPFSLEEATARQRRYGAALGLSAIYTPQLVVDGRIDVVGSDRIGVLRAIEAARGAPGVMLDVQRDEATVIATLGAGPGGTVRVVGYDREHRTPVGRGENGGRTLRESNVVRGMAAHDWDGGAVTLRLPAPAGERVAVLIEARDGAILAAG